MPYGGPPPGWQPPRPVHKPGAIPLRPLTLTDIYDATFKIIRFNPKATVGSAVLIAAIAMSLPVLVTAVLAAGLELSFDPASDDLDTASLVGLLGAYGSLMFGVVLMSLGLVLVTGMIAHVVQAAAVGRRLGLGQAWAATHGARWRLIGLTILLGFLTTLMMTVYVVSWVPVVMNLSWQAAVVYGLVSVPAFIALMIWFWVRVYYLPVPALMLERAGVFGAIGRGFDLTRGAFWRTFGIALLTFVIAQIGGGILGMPFSLIASFAPFATGPGEASVLVMMVFTAIGSVATAAFVAPFTACVTVLQYVDLRMRTEAYDVELIARAGLAPRDTGAT